MKKLIFAITIFTCTGLLTFAQNPEQLEIATQVYKIIQEKGEQHIFEGDEAELFKNMVSLCHESVVADIEQEAADIGMDRDFYADSPKSMEKFNEKLAAHVENIDNLSMPQLLWIMFKSAQRIQIQAGGRFIPENFDKNLEIAQSHLYKIGKKLNFPM